ncbi:MAG TPA: hypothetical protein VEF89_11450 [Solirubrobacteraceae bacterium]|nr:hypothetical protein [Solirubrobacteraceae bacterium]
MAFAWGSAEFSLICTVTEPSPFLVMAYAGGVPAMLRASKTAAPTPVSPSEALAAGRESVELRLQRKTGGEAPLDFGESILGGEVERQTESLAGARLDPIPPRRDSHGSRVRPRGSSPRDAI